MPKMNKGTRILLSALALWLLLAAPGKAAAAAGDWWARLALRDPEGKPLARPGRWVVLVFMSPECPLANASVPVLNALAREFAAQGFGFIGVYADPALAPAALRTHARDYALAFATADDRDHRLVRATGATYTPEVFVFTAAGTRLYHGRIDDRVGDFGEARPTATQQDLRDVLAALAAGQAGPFPDRPGFGCAIAEAVRP